MAKTPRLSKIPAIDPNQNVFCEKLKSIRPKARKKKQSKIYYDINEAESFSRKGHMLIYCCITEVGITGKIGPSTVICTALAFGKSETKHIIAFDFMIYLFDILIAFSRATLIVGNQPSPNYWRRQSSLIITIR
jgi:hypothetical protein